MIKTLHTALGIRNKSIKIVQIPANANLSKADRIKKLNFENKYLYGPALSKKKVKAASADVDPQPSEEVKNPNDIQSEIYWTCHHVPEVQDFTKPAKKAKYEPKTKTAAASKTAKPKDATKSKVEDLNLQSEVVPAMEKEKKKKAKVAKDSEIPTIEDVASGLPLAVKNSRSSLSKNEQIDSDSESSADEREIPFKSDQLRAILNFPMSLSSSKVISSFDKFALDVPSIQLPSVSKVLQATMPENQRQALMRWKTKKIAELGLEGFEIMQKCKFTRILLDLDYLFVSIPSPSVPRQAVPRMPSITLQRRAGYQIRNFFGSHRDMEQHRTSSRHVSSSRSTDRREDSASLLALSGNR